MLLLLFFCLATYAELVLGCRTPILDATIPLSGMISGDIDLRTGRLVAIFVPVLNGVTYLNVQGGFTTVSANFVRCQQHDSIATTPSGDIRFRTLSGSAMVLWPETLPSPPYIRVEVDSQQTAIRSLQVLYRASR